MKWKSPMNTPECAIIFTAFHVREKPLIAFWTLIQHLRQNKWRRRIRSKTEMQNLLWKANKEIWYRFDNKKFFIASYTNSKLFTWSCHVWESSIEITIWNQEWQKELYSKHIKNINPEKYFIDKETIKEIEEIIY